MNSTAASLSLAALARIICVYTMAKCDRLLRPPSDSTMMLTSGIRSHFYVQITRQNILAQKYAAFKAPLLAELLLAPSGGMEPAHLRFDARPLQCTCQPLYLSAPIIHVHSSIAYDETAPPSYALICHPGSGPPVCAPLWSSGVGARHVLHLTSHHGHLHAPDRQLIPALVLSLDEPHQHVTQRRSVHDLALMPRLFCHS